MIGLHRSTAGLPTGLATVLAALALLTLGPPALATPAKGGGMGGGKSGGCGGCGGGSKGASPEEIRQARDGAKEGASGGADAAEGGSYGGSGGGSNRDLTGSIAALGEAEAKAEDENARRRPSPAVKGLVLDNINTLIDAGVSEEQAERLKGIARRATDIARSDEDLVRISNAIKGEIARQKEADRIFPHSIAQAKEDLKPTLDPFWRDDKDAYGKGGMVRDGWDLLTKAGEATEAVVGKTHDLADGTVNLAVDAARAIGGAPDAQRLIEERYDAVTQATRDGLNKGVEMASGAAGSVAGKFSDAVRDTGNLINDPNLRKLAVDEAKRQGNELASDVSQAFDENESPQQRAATDRLIERLPGGDQFLKGTENPDMPVEQRVIHTTLGTAQAVGTAAVVAQGVGLGTAAINGLRGAGTAAAGATTEVAVARAGTAAAAGAGGEAAAANAGGQAVVGRFGQQVVGKPGIVGQQVVGRAGQAVPGRIAGATEPVIAGGGAATTGPQAAITGPNAAVTGSGAVTSGSPAAASGAAFDGARTIP